MKFDDVLREIGEFGPLQKRVAFLCTVPVIFTAFEAMSTVFIFNIPQHRCAIPGFPNDQYQVIDDRHLQILNATIPTEEDGKWSKCYVYSDVTSDVIAANQSDAIARLVEGRSLANGTSKCDQWVYDHSVFDHTIPIDFDVVCQRSVLRASSNMVAEIGCLVGTLSSGLLADRFGRKIPFYLGSIALSGGGFGIAFCHSIITLNLCRFIIGYARVTLFTNGLLLGMEIVGPSKRVFAGIFIELMWSVGSVILLLVAYFVRNWRYLEIIVSIPSLFLLAYWWLIPESPRWLAARGRKEEAMKILEKIAASNKTALPKVDDVTELLECEKALSFRHVFKSRELIIRVIVLYINQFAVVVMYYALLYNITNLSGDIFLNFLMNVLVETLGLTCPYFVLDRLGRRKVYLGCVFLGGLTCVACILPVLLRGPDWIITAMALGGRFFVSAAFSTVYIYAAELFPTVIRSSTMAVGVAFTRFGGMIGPYLADVGILVGGRLEKALPMIVMGAPALVVILFALRLPETKGRRMPETLQDVHTRKGGTCSCRDERSDSEEKEDEANIQMTTATPC